MKSWAVARYIFRPCVTGIWRSIKRAHLLFSGADDVFITKAMYNGLTDEMLFITYTGEHDKLSELPAKIKIDIKNLVADLYDTNFSQSVYPF